ncbi:DUF447 domain-containing protein [Archaeoglobus profundus]|uniref:DUF447 family protein n=1 Tax=Archaeoglobus profundus (strain DSM 5631 / JCM 9629 / NBRC 100127 / Av18) TaxID=572546 RepID=D2RGL2_ARCPA|nr:DUF447 domain-containing protein [Archaeoglobus profundus]ADB57437.1 protein of unknown function DUF447 [Archaeoglobus profundus DSM 5631]
MKLSDFGFTDGINEVIGITIGEWINTAPLGIIVENPESTFAKLRIYPSHTRENLKKGTLYVNIVHDPLVFTISAFDDLSEDWFESSDPPIINGALAWCQFKANLKNCWVDLELSRGEVLRKGLRAVNRGFNALIEALVHATRLKQNPKLIEKVRYYAEIVEKCGGRREKEALEVMWSYLRKLYPHLSL